jgi:superfamily I DNA and/or RNA helicase
LQNQRIVSAGPVQGSGLRLLSVPHTGNQSSSPEEADRIASLVRKLLDAKSEWVNVEGNTRPLTLNDVLIITPYNAQERLPGARIGTVDKFQGQEAPIVIYSLTTSTQADAPHGMEFLYSLNRLNRLARLKTRSNWYSWIARKVSPSQTASLNCRAHGIERKRFSAPTL